ncbi:MAG TPA: DUF4396 domain-containing protein [Flexivirga sp.]|uniref:DUF4396 domain-containing protein n=1 Tax=Flexivirga sp. TaxID=1962927 RepID=UPI002C9F8FF0|nr:DUF4396 domain-containing protein [Flexivirga sp.]HWC21399.1 DUF4396 domain-containing protein [Flexivirga sp.]
MSEQHQHDHHPADSHGHHPSASLSMAVAATLHCLTGCAIGEIAGMMIAQAAGLGNGWSVAISIGLAFVFGYSLSTLPLLKVGVAPLAALSVVLAADTLSIAAMEVTDNLVMVLLPGAMNAGLVNVVFWVGMMISLTAAFFVAVPVNQWLLSRGKGHALTHEFHGMTAAATGWRRWLPALPTGALVAVLIAFMLGGLVVSTADEAGWQHSSVATATASHRV